MLKKQILSFAAALFSLIVALVALSFVSSQLKTREQRVLSARDQLASFEQHKRIFEEEAKQLSVLKTKIESFEQYLLSEAMVPELLSSFEQMAQARSVQFVISAVQYTPATQTRDPLLSIDITATGTIAAIEAFIQDILSQSYQAHFSRFTLSSVGEGQWQFSGGVTITSF